MAGIDQHSHLALGEPVVNAPPWVARTGSRQTILPLRFRNCNPAAYTSTVEASGRVVGTPRFFSCLMTGPNALRGHNGGGRRASTPCRVTTESPVMPYKDIADEQRRNRSEAARERHRRWRAANPGYYAEYRARNKAKRDAQVVESKRRNAAHEAARNMVRNRVQKQHLWPVASVFKCSDCNAQASHYHHEDYDLWWSVEPLCTKCHGVRHRKP